MAYQRFGDWGTRSAENNPHLSQALQKAHLPMRAEVYFATVYQTMFIVGALTLIPAIGFVVLLMTNVIDLPVRSLVLLVPLPLVSATVVYLLAVVQPDLKASARTRDINARLPYALNFISTMASAGATPEAIFHSLSKQPIYGAVAEEAAWIDRDLKLMGYDIVTSLNKAIDRSPSSKFQDFVQGVITVLTSGGSMKEYFNSKADQFLYENQQEQKKFIEGLGVMAESFVVVVVAAPLFLIVMLSVMTMFGSDARQMLLIGYILVLVMLPIAQAGFALSIKYMTPAGT